MKKEALRCEKNHKKTIEDVSDDLNTLFSHSGGRFFVTATLLKKTASGHHFVSHNMYGHMLTEYLPPLHISIA